ncbi:MAG: AAA family ATPase [Chloroflexi bacterium]|nr:AAA family ATPase [Chloroflexota bacterium]
MMRLLRAHIQNFKLLEDVSVEFSTDPSRPLTVIRAENGSGKTSLLYAFQWAFYGMSGLPESAKGLRLSSSTNPTGAPVSVSVMIEFEVIDAYGNSGHYRLVRSAIETPSADDSVERSNDRVRLLRITSAGEEEVEGGDAAIASWLPRRLRDVFFTDGDSVQTFISGQIATRKRQDRVQNAIRDLLGIERLRTAAGDVSWAYGSLRAEAAKAGGQDTSQLEDQLESTDASIVALRQRIDALRDRHANMTEQCNDWEKELRNLRGIGDIDKLNERIDRAEQDQSRLERQRGAALTDMSDALRSEAYSWRFLDESLRSGLDVLAELADRRVIPGTSVEVLADRLELGECICGEPLLEGSEHRAHVLRLLEEQKDVPSRRQRLTELSHIARQSEVNELSRIESRQDFQHMSARLLDDYREASDGLRDKAAELKGLKASRSSIDEERVRYLTSHIEDVDAKIAEANHDIGARTQELEQAETLRQKIDSDLQKALNAAKLSGDLAMRRDVAQDLDHLANNVLKVLQDDYVDRVSERMKQLFMEIVGSPDSPEREDFGPSLFAGVHIDSEFNIIIDTHDGKSLDPDFELNGASKRALTLSFIWALMEVSAVTAPRVIDTPLGMVSGGVKQRMVDAVTKPPSDDQPDFQVVLFLTRSELRDVEGLIDARAGAVVTLSCSHHYPADLVFPWDSDYPVSRLCQCNHRQSCRVCARRYDDIHGVVRRDD